MVVDKPVVTRLSLFSVQNPLLNVLEDLVLFEVEVQFYDCFKAFRRVFNVVYHRVEDVAVPDDIGVRLVFALSFLCAGFSFESGFIEINIITHNDSLKRDQYL